jgi:hypothetical protein
MDESASKRNLCVTLCGALTSDVSCRSERERGSGVTQGQLEWRAVRA